MNYNGIKDEFPAHNDVESFGNMPYYMVSYELSIYGKIIFYPTEA